MKCVMKLIWDNESCRWHCESEDVPGFLLESNSCDALIDRVRIGLPEFLTLDSGYKGDLQIFFETERVDNLKVVAS